MKKNLSYLNVGCGHSFHADWTNIDFSSTGPNVIEHNLLRGIPFPDESFDVVYHSHVLEHFSKKDGEALMVECYRVLRKGGTIRIAVPDLERIINEYRRIFSELKTSPNNEYLKKSYDWILLELFDQTVRNRSGGEMADFLRSEKIVNEDYVLSRCGFEVKQIIDSYRSQKRNINKRTNNAPLRTKTSIKQKLKRLLLKKLLGEGYELHMEIGKFRSSGEIHQWMYDEYSLGSLMREIGFEEVEVCSAFESRILDWKNFGLETINDKVRKPDSLFMEATK